MVMPPITFSDAVLDDRAGWIQGHDVFLPDRSVSLQEDGLTVWPESSLL